MIEVPVDSLYRFHRFIPCSDCNPTPCSFSPCFILFLLLTIILHSNLGENFIENPLSKLSEIACPLAKNLAIQLMQQAGVGLQHLEENQVCICL